MKFIFLLFFHGAAMSLIFMGMAQADAAIPVIAKNELTPAVAKVETSSATPSENRKSSTEAGSVSRQIYFDFCPSTTNTSSATLISMPHYTMDDLVSASHRLEPDLSDPKHHTMDELF